MKPTLNWAIERPHVRDQSEKRGILTATRLYTVTNMLLYRNLLASFYPLKAEFNFLAIQAVFPLIFFLFRPCFLWFSFYSGRVPYDFLSIFRPFSQWFSCYSGRVSSDFLAIQAVFPLTFFLFRQCSLWWYEHTGTAQIPFWGQEDGSASWCSMWRVSVVRSYYRVSWMMTVHHQHSIQPPAHPPISFKLMASSSIIATRKMRMIISRSYRPFYTKSWNALQSIHTGKQ